MSDPWVVLGIAPDATIDAAVAARRRLAALRHPDVGGSTEAMQELNAAFDAFVAAYGAVAPQREPSPAGMPAPDPAPGAVRHEDSGWSRRGARHGSCGLQRDEPSFTIDRLPVEAFEALQIAAAILGEVLDDDPPYVLEVALNDPGPCWCRLDVVPEAGSSAVSLIVGPVEPGAEAPHVEDVRDRWVDTLNAL